MAWSLSIPSVLHRGWQSSNALCLPRALGGGLRNGLSFLRGTITLRYLYLRYRHVVREMFPLAMHLEREVFPALRSRGVRYMTLAKAPDAECLEGRTESETIRFPTTDALATAMRGFHLERVVFDTNLESGQLVEGTVIFLSLDKHLPRAEGKAGSYSGWRASRIAEAMCGPDGYMKFCTRLRYNRDAQELRLDYEYCALYLSRAVRGFVSRRQRFGDHRELFRSAPRAAALMFLLYLTPAFVSGWGVAPSIISTVLLGAVTSTMVYIGLYTLGSIEYDREHQEGIRQGYWDRIQELARFPETNPGPMLKLSPEGDIVYYNQAARRLAGELCLEGDCIETLLPSEYRQCARMCAMDRTPQEDVEAQCAGRVLHWTFSFMPGEDAVIAVAADVTRLKEMEAALRHANLHLEVQVRSRTEELSRTREATILCLAGLAETRDPETGQHLERTRHYVRALAEYLSAQPMHQDTLTPVMIDRLFNSAPLHDIGKVGVPDAVLLKPGRLTEEEFAEIRKHPTYGGDALKLAERALGFESFLSTATEIAYHHHERWDGKGYPAGLSGKDIPLAARLMSLADVYDALTSKRPYKEPWSHADARTEIIRGRGTQFDPQVVDAFLAIEDDFIRIATQFSEP